MKTALAMVLLLSSLAWAGDDCPEFRDTPYGPVRTWNICPAKPKPRVQRPTIVQPDVIEPIPVDPPHQYALQVIDIPQGYLPDASVKHNYVRIDLTDGTMCSLTTAFELNGKPVQPCKGAL